MSIIILKEASSPGKGKAISNSEEETQKFVQELRESGATVTLRRTYFTLLGVRVESNPKTHKISWTY